MAMEAALMNEQRMAQIIKEYYTLSELEERLNTKPEDLDNGVLYYVDQNFEEVQEFLREDLWFD